MEACWAEVDVNGRRGCGMLLSALSGRKASTYLMSKVWESFAGNGTAPLARVEIPFQPPT